MIDCDEMDLCECEELNAFISDKLSRILKAPLDEEDREMLAMIRHALNGARQEIGGVMREEHRPRYEALAQSIDRSLGMIARALARGLN